MYGNGATNDDFLSFNFPTTALASFDDDFLSLLQKHTKPLVNPQQPQSNNPLALSTFPNPTITPPSSGTDESPSPPSVNTAQDNLSRNPSSSAIAQPPMSARTTRSSNRDSQSDILGKRKAEYIIDDDDDDDDLDILPPHKQLHTDTPGRYSPFGPYPPLTATHARFPIGSSATKKPSKRKSGGTAQVRPILTSHPDYRSIDTGQSFQDEYRLQKRKEQNRAAQRAFRERKEKHVKDVSPLPIGIPPSSPFTHNRVPQLEDKVSMLEAKTDTQAAENENLRELLTRLQNENVQLKQAQFNFTFQQSPPSAGGSGTSAAGPSGTGGRHPSQSSQSPTEPVLTQNPTPPTSKATPDIHLFDAFSTSDSLSSFGISPSPTTNATANGTTNGNDLSWLNMFNAFPGATNGSSPNSATFNGGGMPYQTIASNPMFTSFREPTPNAWASFGAGPVDVNMNSYDELFGGGGTMASSSLMEDLLTYNAFLPDPTGSNLISPLPRHVTPPPLPETSNRLGSNPGATLNGAISNNSEASTSGSSSGQQSPHNAKDCPKSKSDFEAMIKKNSQDTFGPPVSTANPMDENGLRCTIVPADPTKVNLDLGTAWKAVRQHPQFEVSLSPTS